MDKRVANFDGWRVEFDSGEISKDGKTHRLPDQPLQILEELVTRPGEVVTREQLIARLWPTGVVEFDSSLNSAMRKLRIALGDDADTPRYIETLPRKGYRFVGQLEPEPPAARIPSLPTEYIPTSFETGAVIGRRASDRRAPYRRLALGLGSIFVAIVLAVVAWHLPAGHWFGAPTPSRADLPTVVVLPLRDMSVDGGQQPLCDGLTEELSNWLAHIPNLNVVARTSAFAFKGKDADVRDIGRALGATHVLEGSLRRSEGRLRITVQLIEAEKGLHLWSRSFDMPIGDIFTIEDTVSRAVAEALHLELAADTDERWSARQPVAGQGVTEAYEYYLLGRARQRLRTAEDNKKAVDYFRRAVAIEPDYALALVGLSESLLNGLSLNHTPLEDVTIEVEPLINRALAIDPKLADALAVEGWLRTEQSRYDEALPLLQQATSANPNDASSHRFLGDLYDRRANPVKALEHYSISARLDPMDFLPHVFRCMTLPDLGDFAEAEKACGRARALVPENSWGPLATSWLARAQGETRAALEWIERARTLDPANANLAKEKIALLLAQGDTGEARAVLATLPADSGFAALTREAEVEFAAGGAAVLKAWLGAHEARQKAATGAELSELARLQFLAGDAAGARATLAHAQRVLPSLTGDLYDGSQVRFEYSPAVLHAAVELAGGGDRQKAMKLLADLDAMLATYQKNGGTHYGLYLLRAQSLALQGQKDAAAAQLEQAREHGWRGAWLAAREPYLAGVALPADKKPAEQKK